MNLLNPTKPEWKSVTDYNDDEVLEDLERNKFGQFRLRITKNDGSYTLKPLTRAEAALWCFERMVPSCLREQGPETVARHLPAQQEVQSAQRKLEAAKDMRDALAGVRAWIDSTSYSFRELMNLHTKCSTAIKAWDEASQ